MQVADKRESHHAYRMQLTSSTSTAPEHSRTEPLRMRARDGRDLAARIFAPRSQARAAAVVLAGTAIPQGFYARFAAFLAERDIAVLTFDYRGTGLSRTVPLREERATMSEWATLDVEAALEALDARFSHVPRVAVAHSFGGQALGLARSARRVVSRAVLVGSQSGFVGNWPRPQRLRNQLVFGAVMPAAAATLGYWPADMGLGDGLPGGVMREWARWCRTPGYLAAFVPESERFHAQLSIPLRSYRPLDDDYAPEAAVEELLGWYTKAQIERRVVAPRELGARAIGHYGLFRERVGGALWPEIAAFLRGEG